MSASQPEDQSDPLHIICPYCEHGRRAEPCEGDADESPDEEECEQCGKVFVRWATISITYNTKAKP